MNHNSRSAKLKTGFNTLETAFENWENKKEDTKMTNNKSDNSSFMFFGKIALVGVGAVLLYSNRFKIQRMLESNGIKIPWLNNTVGEAVQSGAAKLVGSVEHEFKVS